MLYGVYLFMAAGYGLIGLMLLQGDGSASPGVHLLTVGALGLAVYAVICIAGYTHSGLEKNGRPWVIVGRCCWPRGRCCGRWPTGTIRRCCLQAAGLMWCAAYALQAWQMLPVFLRARADGAEGCAGVQD